ncbi:hypothetical protein H0H87_009746 [Tephrocybe sp. NHM501043]|nr:hypothetical protein H0H87_009746 [Tephrocybe sp. NHM501043]
MSSSATRSRVPLAAADIIRHFSPTWFAAIMVLLIQPLALRTGAISILFSSFPYGHDTKPMRALSLAFFVLNFFLFLLFSALTIARYTKYPDTWMLMLQHPMQSLYTGCFPMGVTTFINVSVDVINIQYNFGGPNFLYFIWVIWSTTHSHTLQGMTAAWLLPVVTLTVAASSGGVLSLALHDHSPLHALITTTTSVFLVTVGLTLALMLITIYLFRLIVHGLPPGRKILSVFLPLGPTAQSGYAVLLIGQNYRRLLPFEDGGEFVGAQGAGDTVYVICVCGAVMLWSLAVMCIVFALLGIQDSLRRRADVPFGLPFWGLVFPNGVFANLTLALARTFNSRFFRIVGVIYAIATLGIWCFVATRTLLVVWDRRIFEKEKEEDTDEHDERQPQKQDILSHTHSQSYDYSERGRRPARGGGDDHLGPLRSESGSLAPFLRRGDSTGGSLGRMASVR